MTYYSALHYAAKAEKSATSAANSAAKASQASGKIIQLGFDGAMEDGKLVFKHAPSGVEIPYELLDDYEYEVDLLWDSDVTISQNTPMIIKNGSNIITFVSALHRSADEPATIADMAPVMRESNGSFRWLFKAAYKITPAGKHVLLLYPVISSGGSGSGLEIGDIGFAPLGIDETQNKRRYLNGQVISQAQFVSFTNKIKKAVELYPNIATTEGNWQAEVTNSKLGQCGKFVIDDTLGTIRLPKVVNINGLQDLALMGNIKAESLPNITGYIQDQNQYAGPTSATGVFARESLSSSSWIGTNNQSGNYTRYTFDASRSSSTYQDNAPVQQEAIQYPYFIQVATGTEETVDVTREIELNNPFSLLDYKWSEYELNNASWLISNGAFHSGTVYKAVYELLLKIHNGTETKEGVSIKLSTEEYTDTDFVINTADTTFRLPIKVKLASGNAVVGNGVSLGLTNGLFDIGLTCDNQTDAPGRLDTAYSKDAYGANVGAYAVCSVDSSGINKAYGVTTDPTKSGIETSSSGLKLYFYVGETIQDANVINASGVLTKVANSIDRTSATDRETVVGWGMPDYSAWLSVSNPYTVEFPCLVFAQSGTNTGIRLKVNGEYILSGYIGANSGNSYVYGFVDVGDTVQGENYAGSLSAISLKVCPLKGVN